MQVFDRPTPQIRARHFQRLPTQLEKVERNDGRRDQRQHDPLTEREGVQEVIGEEGHAASVLVFQGLLQSFDEFIG